LMQDVPYDPIKDFSPITIAVSSPNILVVQPSMPINSVKELIALAKAKPGQLNYSTGGSGSPNHLAAELFKSMANIDIVRVPYKGTGAALNAVIAGEAQLMFPAAGSTVPFLKSGKLKALGVASAQPSALFPGIPTIAASGLPGYESSSPLAIFAPAKT